ncbi:ABC transporter ATP-binding protein [Peptostreptococcus stomatis]|uniref:ABC transporter ATP-binding protein n=1 Tax=Peptostreptococcus stomatis TaxID=341694 RepID=UPI0023532CF9|nr:ABC transporter ATP-binding protein [Peptostreptococcus stomatis]
MLKTVYKFLELMKAQRKRLYLSFLFNFLDGIFIMIPLVIAYYMVASIPELNKNATRQLDEKLLVLCIVAMVVTIICRIILRYATMRLRSGAGYDAICEKRISLGSHLKHASMGFFSKKNQGDLISTITSDAAFLEIEGIGVIEKAATGIPSLIIGLIFLFCVDYRIFIFSVFLLIPAWYSYRYLASTQDRLNINRQKFIGTVTEETVEFIHGIHILKSCQTEKQHETKIIQIFERLQDESIHNELSHLFPIALFQFWFRAITAGTVFLAGMFFLLNDIDYMRLFLLTLSSFGLFQGIEGMGIFSIFAKMTAQSLERMDMIDNIPVMSDISGEEEVNQFDISYENVSFAYDSTPVLKKISFNIPERTTTALVGLSGSGKTTVINLLGRFWDAQQGKIKIGGKEIQNLSYEYLLRNLSFVFQDVMLFQDSILNNIRIGKPSACLDEVVEAAKKAGCHDFIMKLPDGYDTVPGEGGSTLSGGEKQRIAIARALIKDAPIVLLDEVTANIDVENEVKIQSALQELLKNKTVIMIAHKLSTIQDVDQILVIEDGKISQKGTHNELMKQIGLYKKLWDMQYQTEKWKI